MLKQECFLKKISSAFVGHPVHYILYTDDKELSKNIAKTLASALYLAKRLKSKRISYIEVRPQRRGPFDEESKFSLDTNDLRGLFKAVPGGTIVINPGRMDYETEAVSNDIADVDEVGKMIMDNHFDCLSMILTPKNYFI